MPEKEAPQTAISPTRQENYAEWYRRVVRSADLADRSLVRGCLTIKPWGYAIWENIQRELDRRIKAAGHQNVYFPLFIPLSLLAKEVTHAEGFAKECAVVTRSQIVARPGGDLDPGEELAEPLIVRPTSETIIGAAFASWVESYRDLPVRINQWANVVRWERRTRPLLRTVEILWQEGHTAHESAEEARAETMRMLDVYATFAEDFMAMPVLRGMKTPHERFPGAVETFTIEAMMQDRRALQAGTSHFLGQGFSRASEITFETRDGTREIAWTTSWGVSTRLLGALVMIHGDDDGLMLPPRIAPAHVVILPVLRDDDTRSKVLELCDALAEELRRHRFGDQHVRVEIEQRDVHGGSRRWPWVRRGVPIRLEVGPREVDAGTVTVARRDRSPKDVVTMPRGELVASVSRILEEIQAGLHRRALAYRDEHTQSIDTRPELDAFFTPASRDPRHPEIHGGFALSPWCGQTACEQAIHRALKVTIRCTPLGGFAGAHWEPRLQEKGSCVACGRSGAARVIFAKAY